MLDQVRQGRLTLQLFRDIAPLEAEWRALEEAPHCSIHQTFDWCSSWLNHDARRPLVIVARFTGGEQENRIAFILPLIVDTLGPVRFARYIGAPFANLNFGVFSDAFLAIADADVMRDIRNQIEALPIDADVIALDRQPAMWRGRSHPFTLWPRIKNQNHAFQVKLDGGIDAVVARSGGKRRRRRVRRSERRLRQIGDYRFVRAESAEDAHAMLSTFFQQKTARFEINGIPDVFAPPAVKACLHELVERSVGRDRKLLEMQAIRLPDGTPCAVSALSSKGGHVICQFSSIRTGETEPASPGELLFYYSIRHACEQGAALFDFGVGNEQFKRSWCDVETAHYDTMIAVTFLGQVAALAMRITVFAKRLAKSTPLSFRLARATRHRLQR